MIKHSLIFPCHCGFIQQNFHMKNTSKAISLLNLHTPGSKEGHQRKRDGEDNPENHVWSMRNRSVIGNVFNRVVSVCQSVILVSNITILSQGMTAEIRKLKQIRMWYLCWERQSWNRSSFWLCHSLAAPPCTVKAKVEENGIGCLQAFI